MTKTAVIFARGKDIEKQIERGRQHAENKGYSVEGVIVGQGHELPEIIKGLGKGIDRVIVSHISRISRNALECYTIQANLEIDCGAMVEVATEKPVDEVAERFMQRVIMAVKEYEAGV